jgi:hypothetical protein
MLHEECGCADRLLHEQYNSRVNIPAPTGLIGILDDAKHAQPHQFKINRTPKPH